MTQALANKCVWVTRPQGQADLLCQLIEQQQAEAVHFPVIEIRPAGDTSDHVACFRQLDQYYAIIFTSRNAVNAAFAAGLHADAIASSTRVWAIGAATAEQLHEQGIEKAAHAGGQADSEALLSLPELQSDQINGKPILLVKGLGGRELLAETLISRGASLQLAEVYQRCLPRFETNFVTNLWQNKSPDVILVTSNDGLKNLVELTPDEYRTQLYRTPLVLMSMRMLDYAKYAGFISTLEVAVEKSDPGLLSALLKLSGD